jgi:hypothetical protein
MSGGTIMKWNLLSRVFAALLLSAIGVAPVWAQDDQTEEVVVTGSRMYEGSSSVFIVKRADHLITRVRVTCDTRELSKRRDELKATLRNMIAEAKRSQTISLGLGDSVLGALNESNFDEIIVPDTRADTSQAFVIIKTTISPTDTYNSATDRIKDFIEKTEKAGRTEILREERWDLTLIAPEKYRDALISQIVAQSKKTAELFGSGYSISVDGLEHPVSWNQKGPLDLALYIPYMLHVAPLGAR